MPGLLYLHGFKSSPLSHKAQLLKHYIANQASGQPHPLSVYIPALPPSPREAIASLIQQYAFSSSGDIDAREYGGQSDGKRQVQGVIGSSLGGYYALHLAERFAVPVVLLNPAVRPYELLHHYLGENVNLYTNERFDVTEAHLEELLALRTEPSRWSAAMQRRVLAIVETGDATLNYEEAASLMRECCLWLRPGGSHEVADFDLLIPHCLAFLGLGAMIEECNPQS